MHEFSESNTLKERRSGVFEKKISEEQAARIAGGEEPLETLHRARSTYPPYPRTLKELSPGLWLVHDHLSKPSCHLLRDIQRSNDSRIREILEGTRE